MKNMKKLNCAKSVLFLCIAGKKYGYGHLVRCKSLAEHAKIFGLDVHFLIFTDQPKIRFLEDYNDKHKDINVLKNNPDIDKMNISLFDIIIVDISHEIIFENVLNSQKWLKYFGSRCEKLIAIDSVNDQSIYKSFDNVLFHLIIVPYVVESELYEESSKILVGETYSILSPKFLKIENGYNFNSNRIKILISCGGSDPKNYTKNILESLENYESKLFVNIIIGPLFNKKLKNHILNYNKISKNNVSYVDSPNSIFEYIQGCDIAIGTSGLSKYEFACLGKPSILVSIDQFHVEANKPFVSKGYSFEIKNTIKRNDMHNKLKKISLNYKEISLKARSSIDGKGGQRIINRILDL